MNNNKICGLVCVYSFFRTEKKHRALLTTCERAIAPGGCVLVFYTHHRPHLAHRDMEFFEMASEMRWECEKVLTERFPVRVCLWSFVRFFFRNSLKKLFSYLICHHRYVISLCFPRTRERRRCGQRYMVGSLRERDPTKIVH